jgi:hypothetical protein
MRDTRDTHRDGRAGLRSLLVLALWVEKAAAQMLDGEMSVGASRRAALMDSFSEAAETVRWTVRCGCVERRCVRYGYGMGKLKPREECGRVTIKGNRQWIQIHRGQPEGHKTSLSAS